MIRLLQTLRHRLGVRSVIANNSLWLLIGDGVSRVFNLLFSYILLQRYLGPEEMGHLRFIIQYGVLFSALMDAGLTIAAIRESARAPSERMSRIFGALRSLRVIICALTFAGMGLSLLVQKRSELDLTTQGLIMVWGVSLILQALRRDSEAAFKGLEKARLHATFQLANRMCMALMLPLVVIFKGGPFHVLLIYVLCDTVELILAERRAWNLNRGGIALAGWRDSAAEMKALLRASVPYGLQIFAWQIYAYIDTVLMRYILNDNPEYALTQIGYYSSASQLMVTLQFVPNSVCMATFPALARAWPDDVVRVQSLFRYALRLLLWVSVAVGAALCLLAGEFFQILLGPRYAPAAPMLMMVAWAIPLTFVCVPLANLLAAVGMQSRVTIACSVAAVASIAANLALVPALGGLGAAQALLVSTTTALLIQGVYVARLPGRLLASAPLLLEVALAAGLAVAAWSLRDASLALRMALAAFVGGAAMLRAFLLFRFRLASPTSTPDS